MDTMNTQDYIAEKLAPYGGCDDANLIEEIARTAVDYHRAREAGRRRDANELTARYEELTSQLGFDPLA